MHCYGGCRGRSTGVRIQRDAESPYGEIGLTPDWLARDEASMPDSIARNGLQNRGAKAKLSDGAPEEIRTPDPQIRSLVPVGASTAAFYRSRGETFLCVRLQHRFYDDLGGRLSTP